MEKHGKEIIAMMVKNGGLLIGDYWQNIHHQLEKFCFVVLQSIPLL